MNATRFPRAMRGPGVVRGSAIAFGLLAVVAWVQVLAGGDSGVGDLFRGDTWRRAWGFAGDLMGIGAEGAPAFLDGASWRHAIGLSVETLAMSVLAAGMAGTAALASFLPAARNVAYGATQVDNQGETERHERLHPDTQSLLRLLLHKDQLPVVIA